MASGFFAILDDIAALMDDVAVSSKLATQKTAGILGDDLAVNAEKATGFLSSQELPVLWKITKGSFLNKLIIIPLVFLLNAFLPDAIKIILIAGGLYLAYEGVEKIIEWIFHRSHKKENAIKENEENNNEVEKNKITSAIKTDFILSIEIVFLAFVTVINKSIEVQIATVVIVSIIATIGVYGIVALIVRMDDAGYKLIKHSNNKGLGNSIGNGLVKALPLVIKLLSIVGTIALLMVSGGIFTHNIEQLHHYFTTIPSVFRDMIYGLISGLLTLPIILIVKKLLPKKIS